MALYTTKNGLECFTPSDSEDDSSPRFTDQELTEALSYYRQFGYVIFKSVLSEDQCQEFIHYWQDEVKPHKGFIYRQATAKAEKNIYFGGRLAEYRYYDMHQIIASALTLCKKIL